MRAAGFGFESEAGSAAATGHGTEKVNYEQTADSCRCTLSCAALGASNTSGYSFFQTDHRDGYL